MIAAASCEQEAACNEIGDGRHYGSHDACASQLAARAVADLRARACPSGLDSSVVARCADMLRQEGCHPLSTLSRMYTGRPANLCVHTGTVRLTDEDIYGE